MRVGALEAISITFDYEFLAAGRSCRFSSLMIRF